MREDIDKPDIYRHSLAFALLPAHSDPELS